MQLRFGQEKEEQKKNVKAGDNDGKVAEREYLKQEGAGKRKRQAAVTWEKTLLVLTSDKRAQLIPE